MPVPLNTYGPFILWLSAFKTARREDKRETSGPHAGASQAPSGERKASQGNVVLIVPLDPSYKAGLVGHVPAKRSGGMEWVLSRIEQK